MSEDSQLPAVQDGALPLDAAAKLALKEADYDSRIVDSVNELAKVGTFIPRNATPEYVKAIQFERQEGLRASQKYWEALLKEARLKIQGLNKRLKAISDREEHIQSKVDSGIEINSEEKLLLSNVNKLRSDIDKLTNDMAGYAANQIRYAESGMKNEANMLDLFNKTKKSGPPESGGNRSWDPDAPLPSVHVSIHNEPGGSVSVDGRNQ